MSSMSRNAFDAADVTENSPELEMDDPMLGFGEHEGAHIDRT